MKELKKALLFVAGFTLLASNVLAQSPAAAESESEPNRITGAKFDVKYSADKTAATYYVTNISNKIIATVRVTAIREGNPPHRSITERNLKPGESITSRITVRGPMTVFLDAIIYADGSMETRNGTVAAVVEKEEKGKRENHDQWIAADRAFAAVNPDILMPQEEQIVRKSYAKLSFETELAILGDFISRRIPATSEEANKLLESRIHFELSEFQVGDFAEIEFRPWTQILNPSAPQDLFHMLYGGSVIQMDGHGHFLRWFKVKWKKNPIKTEEQADVQETETEETEFPGAKTVKDVVKIDKPGDWTRYALFTVNATLDGRTITYPSLFLFANLGETVASFDPALHTPVELLTAAPYPQALIESAYRELPLVKTWIAKSQLSSCKKFNEPEICCDAATGRCGLPSEDVARSLNVPISDKDRAMVKAFLEPAPAPSKQVDATRPVSPEE